MDAPSLTAAVRRELLRHPGVTEADHRFGGVVFHVGRREIGHIHGERVADLPLPRHIREQLAASGRVSNDHAGAESDWVSRQVDGPGDVAEIVELFRLSYEHAAAEAARAPAIEEQAQPAAPGPRSRWRGLLRRH
jgi:hypothetical protein